MGAGHSGIRYSLSHFINMYISQLPMKNLLLSCLMCVAGIAPAIAQPIPTVLQPNHEVMGESKHLCSRAEHHSHSAALIAPFSSAVIRRNYDVLSYDLFMDWTHPLQSESVGAEARRYTGANTVTIVVDSANASHFVFNAANMKIDKVEITPHRTLTFSQPHGDTREFFIDVNPAFAKGDTAKIIIEYTTNSDSNIGFNLYPKGMEIGKLPDGSPDMVEERLAYTMSEPYMARFWMPCNDLPYDKVLASISVRVPKPFTVAANGLLQEIRDAEDNTQVFVWKSSSPIATYLMAVSSSIYKEFGEWYHRRNNPNDSIPVLYYVWQKDYDATATNFTQYNARYAFRNTVRMMEDFSTRYTEYPFEKYGMVSVQPFGYGGMEHQSISTINRRWTRFFDDPGIAHELMHQWTGNLVTCASFNDIWLNEGGATHGEALWAEVQQGRNGYMKTMLDKRGNYLYSASNTNPIYAPDNIFNYATTYAKAGWIYHMLRQMLGDELYFATMKTYFAEFAYQSIETSDMVEFFTRTVPNPPVPFSTFFDQWVYGAGHPIYKTHFSTRAKEEKGYPITIVVEQIQTGARVASVFAMPLKITLKGENNQREVVSFTNDQRVQTLSLHTPFAVTGVVLNEENDVLAETEDAIVGVREIDGAAISHHVEIVPNPVRIGADLLLHVALPSAGALTVELLDMLGRPVQVLYDGMLLSGAYQVSQRVSATTPGVYFVKITSGQRTDLRKLLLVD